MHIHITAILPAAQMKRRHTGTDIDSYASPRVSAHLSLRVRKRASACVCAHQLSVTEWVGAPVFSNGGGAQCGSVYLRRRQIDCRARVGRRLPGVNDTDVRAPEHEKYKSVSLRHAAAAAGEEGAPRGERCAPEIGHSREHLAAGGCSW